MKSLDAFKLKLIAIAAMTIDHINTAVLFSPWPAYPLFSVQPAMPEMKAAHKTTDTIFLVFIFQP